MAFRDLVVCFGGESGEGIVTLGEVVARVAAREGYEIYTFRTYPAEIRGGQVLYQMRVGTHRLTSQGDRIDLLVALNQRAYDQHKHELAPDGAIIRESTVELDDGESRQAFTLPLDDLASEIQFSRGRNIIAAGAVAQLMGFGLPAGLSVVEQRMGQREALLAQNLQALESGYRFAESSPTTLDSIMLPAVDAGASTDRLVLSGNQALALGALAAGCRFFAGYPITPATGILEMLAGELPKVGGTLVQAEDEMAALAMVIGASYSGQRAMTATSGPGLALMIELLGLASITEIPLVIVNVQRAGPSTGMPTKTAQGDLFLSTLGGHDEAPRLVLAPTSVEDCFYLMVEAFNLAERYQMPAIVLSDQSLSMRLETVPKLETRELPHLERLLADRDADGNVIDYLRYRVTDSGISPMSLPGMPGGQYTAEGLEHLPSGAPCYDATNHEEMMRKRFRKLQTALDETDSSQTVATCGTDRPDIAVLCWGSTAGAVWEAVEQARGEGISAGGLAIRLLSPLPDQVILGFVSRAKAVLVPEANYTGQLAHMLRAPLESEAKSILRYGGTPFAPGDILAALREAHHG